jgi:hypothetical protein
METELSLSPIMLNSTGLGTHVYPTVTESTTLTTTEVCTQQVTMYTFYCKCYIYLNNLNIDYVNFYNYEIMLGYIKHRRLFSSWFDSPSGPRLPSC